MAKEKAPKTFAEFSKSKFITLFKCNKRACGEKTSSPRMISQAEVLALLKGKKLTKRYGNAHSAIQTSNKERD